MHHLTAAVPYVSWLQEADAKGVNNQFKQAASASIATIRRALQKAVMSTYDSHTDDTRSAAQNVLLHNNSTLSGVHQVTLADGSFKKMKGPEYNRSRHDELQQEANERDRGRAEADKAAGEEAVRKTSTLCDNVAIQTFDKLHTLNIKARDDLMDLISSDLQLWLRSDAFTEKALGRYNQNADPTLSPDGRYCAGQLCAILLQMDSSPKGRQWFGALDTFTPGQKNLVWRMLSFNNKIIGAELEQALKHAIDPLPYGEKTTQDAQHNEKNQQAIDQTDTVLSGMSKLLTVVDAIRIAKAKLGDPLSKAGMANAGVYWKIGRAATDNILSVLLVSVLERVQKMPVTALERHIAKGQILVMANGLGSDAQRLVKNTKSIKGNLATAIQGTRVPLVLAGLSMLSIIPKLGTAAIKQDARSVSEAGASIAEAMGTLKGVKADFYNETVLKQAPTLVRANRVAITLETTTQTLRRMRARAAVFVVAGSAVGVWWDVVDGKKAYKEEEFLLLMAYSTRALTGTGTIFTAIASVFLRNAALSLFRVNIYLLIVSTLATMAISKLSGEAWVNWLLAQPFRAATVWDVDKNASRVNNKTPFGSEAQMMSKLGDALSDFE